MPAIRKRSAPFKPQKGLEIQWDTFTGGWNNIFKPTELEDNELTQADNLMLTGKGIPTGRWGSNKFFLAQETGRVRLLDAYYNSLTSTNALLAVTDDGLLTKKSGASYEVITGGSFLSGANLQSVQLDNKTYIASASQQFMRFNGTDLTVYEAISTPQNPGAALLSPASGTNLYGYKISAVSEVGETIASVQRTLASMPLDLTTTLVDVTWDKVSAASGVLTGYNIYRGKSGDESYIGTTGPDATNFLDTGEPTTTTQFAPTEDTTGGIRAKYILKFDDRLVLSGVPGDPSIVYISGRWPFHDKFTIAAGGGNVSVSPNDGDDVSGLGVAGSQSTDTIASILVFKGKSVHRVTLTSIQVGTDVILDPIVQELTASNGCSSADTIVNVENDVFYFGREGHYTIGQEPQFLNQIRTNELSARIRPYVRNLSSDDFNNASAGYLDNKYILSFPTKNESIIYDRERLAYMGPWKTPFGITKWLKYFDEAGAEKWLAGTDNNGFVYEFSDAFVSDAGQAVSKILRTKKGDFGDWSVLKVIRLFYVRFRNVRSSVTVNLRIETKDGNTVTTKTFSISSQLGDGGFGSDQFGDIQFGDTEATISLTGDELVRYGQIYKQARVVQVEVISTDANANFEFLGTRITGQNLGDQSLPSSLRV